MSTPSEPYLHESGFAAIESGGYARILNRWPATNDRSGLRRFAAPLVPQADWQALDFRGQFGPSYVVDQDGFGACVGASSTCALAKSRVLAGQPYERLSGMCCYAQVNGGRDQGAMIGDSLQALATRGTCLESEIPYSSQYVRKENIPSGAWETAKRFKILEAFTLESWEEACSALQLGFVVVGPVMVGNKFMHLDANGVAGWDNGPGNHSVHWDGMKKLPSGEWVIDLQNTWNTSFGQQGRCYTTRKHFESVQTDAYAIRAAITDPNAPVPPTPQP